MYKLITVSFLLFLAKFTIAQDVYIPDPNFLHAAAATGDLNNDGKMQYLEAENVTYLELRDHNINDLTGIEAFINLKVLLVGTNNLSTLDISKNTELTFLNCAANNLSNLDLSNNPKIDTINCSENNFSSIDISNLTNLRFFWCGETEISSFDFSHNPLLSYVLCENNKLVDLDFSHNPDLTYAACSNNYIKKLNFTMNPELKFLICDTNSLESLDLSNNPKLDSMYCRGNSQLNTICVAEVNFANQYYHKDSEAMFSNCLSANFGPVKSQYTVYPNPATSVITAPGIQELVIYNIKGELVTQGKSESLSVINLENGIYFIHLIYKDGRKSIIEFLKE